MTFEPDGAGFNNNRMAMESTIGLSIPMGRTLVMPPQKRMYNLGKGDNEQQKHFSFADFFPIYEVAQEHDGLKVISMEDYLKQHAMTGKLRHQMCVECACMSVCVCVCVCVESLCVCVCVSYRTERNVKHGPCTDQ
jgi:hypothetical protein